MKKKKLMIPLFKMQRLSIILLLFVFPYGGYSQSINLFPPIPDFATNPYAVSMFDAIIYDANFPTNSFNVGKEVLQCAIAYNHPQKASFGLNQSAVEVRLLFLLDGIFSRMQSHTSGYYNTFDNVFQTMAAYAMTIEKNPGIISAANKTSWESAMQSNLAAIISSRGTAWTLHKQFWYNADVRYGLALLIAGDYFNNSNYTSHAENMLHGPLTTSVLPDGGMNYVGYQNETFTYHVENIESLAWWYLFTYNQTTKDILRKSVNYYPLSIQDGVAEYYTAVSWKHYWNTTIGDVGAYIAAAISGDKQNYRLGKDVSGELLPAFLYNSNLSEASQPDNYVLYDENIQGPRGKFGAWNFAATGRDPSNTSESNVIGLGKKTFVGGMILTENNTNWPLNAAFDMATVEIKVSSGVDTDLRRIKHRYYSVNEENANVMGNTFASLSTKYSILNKTATTPDGWNTMPWTVDQQWIVGEDRIVGRLGIQPNSSQSVYAVRTFLKFVSGRNWWGVKKDWVPLGNNTWSYGDLIIKVHTNDFKGGIETGYTDTFSGTANKSGYMLIQDNKSFGLPEALRTYTTSDEYYCLIEIYPNNKTAANSITSVATGSANFEGYKVVEGSKVHIMVANKKATSASYTFSPDGSYQYTTAFKSWDGSTQEINSSQSITIPAYQHVLLVSSNDPAEHVYNNNKYLDIFSGSTVPVTGVSVSPSSLSLKVGETSELAANISPANASDKYVSWYSSNPSVATVNSNGFVTAIGNGSAQITCTSYNGGHTGNCDVTVSSAVPQGTIYQTEDMTLTNATVHTHYIYSNGQGVQAIQPEGTTAEASFVFPEASGVYDITVGYVIENDGQPLYKLYVNGTVVESWTAPLASNPFEFTTRKITRVSINNGDVVKITSVFTNGAYGRTDFLDIITSDFKSVTLNVSQNILIQDAELLVYPNPVCNEVSFEFNGFNESDVSLRIIDLFGKVVLTKELKQVKGKSLVKLNLDDANSYIANGIYFYQIHLGGFSKTGKLVIKKSYK